MWAGSQLLTTSSRDHGWLTPTRRAAAWDPLSRGGLHNTWDRSRVARTREVIKTQGPPGTVCLRSTWSPELLSPGKGAKGMPSSERPSQNCVWVSPEEVRVSSGLPQGLWVQTWVWHKPSWRRSPLTPPQNHQNLHRPGETDSWRAETKLCKHQNPGERSSNPHRELTCECPGVSSGGMGQGWPASESETLREAVCAWDLLKEVAIIFITSTIVWPQVKQQGGNTAPPINRKLKIYWTWPRPSVQDPVSPSVSLSHQEASTSLLFLSIRGQIPKTTVTEN